MIRTIIKWCGLTVLAVILILYLMIGAVLQESYKLYPLTETEIAQREGK